MLPGFLIQSVPIWLRLLRASYSAGQSYHIITSTHLLNSAIFCSSSFVIHISLRIGDLAHKFCSPTISSQMKLLSSTVIFATFVIGAMSVPVSGEAGSKDDEFFPILTLPPKSMYSPHDERRWQTQNSHFDDTDFDKSGSWKWTTPNFRIYRRGDRPWTPV